MAGDTSHNGTCISPLIGDSLRESILKDVEALLAQKDEQQQPLWRKGQAEVRKLQQEQQTMAARITEMQEQQAALSTETSQLRDALFDVTSKFETVTKNMREIVQGVQHHVERTSTPAHAVATPSATPAQVRLGDALRGDKPVLRPTSGVEDCTAVVPEPPGFDRLEAAYQQFCTPTRGVSSGLDFSYLTGQQRLSHHMMSMSAPAAGAVISGVMRTPEVKRLQLSECLLEEPSPCAQGQHRAASSSALHGALDESASTSLASRPAADTPAGEASTVYIQLVKEKGFTTLGLEVDKMEESALQVTVVDDDGFVGRHNLRQDAEQLKVLVGDLITSVNAVRNNAGDMLRELSTSQEINLSIDRSRKKGLYSPDTATLPSPSAKLRADACAFVPSSQKEDASLARASPHAFGGCERLGLHLPDAIPPGFEAHPLGTPGILSPYLPAMPPTPTVQVLSALASPTES